MSKTNVIILASGDIRHKLKFLKINIPCPALIPINTKPISYYILDYYDQKPNLNIYLCIERSQKEIVQKELQNFNNKFNIITVNSTDGVISSLEKSLKAIPYAPETIINPVTTIPCIIPKINEVIIANKKKWTSEWSCIDFENKTPILISKNEPGDKYGYGFTGIFKASTDDLENALAKVNYRNDLIEIIRKLEKPIKFKKSHWIDCGHETNFYDAKCDLITSREFNTIKVIRPGILKKSSRNIEKFQQEINFIKMLPTEISTFFPRIYSSIIVEDQQASINMEHYGYPNLSELLLYWGYSKEIWERIFLSLKHTLEKFREYPYSIGFKANENFYKQKLKRRVLDFHNIVKQNEEKTDWLYNEITVNGDICYPIEQFQEKIFQKIDSLYNENDFCISHGDFCFNNILYDISSNIIKLIDPRGSFGERCVGIYGDLKYDLAKIQHSASAYYDYLANDLFILESNDYNFEYSFNLRSNNNLFDKLTRNLINDLGYQVIDISFITATLFLTMSPMHSDSYNRQKAMYLHGLSMINRILE